MSQEVISLEDSHSTITDQTGTHQVQPLPGMLMHYHTPDVSGFNTFEPGTRLRRHVHISADGNRLVAENICIFNHPILLEKNGKCMLIEPGTKVRIGAGVPHSWMAMEIGTRLPNGTICEGPPLMTFEYEGPVRGFSLCQETETFENVADVPEFPAERKDELLFPKLTQAEILELPYVRGGEYQYWDGKPHTIPDEKRLPLFRPGKVLNTEEFQTAIVGFGNVGATIALSYALKGLSVHVHDNRPEAYGEGMCAVDGALAVLEKHKQITMEEATAARARIVNMPELNKAGLAGKKFIVESIYEELKLKQQMFKHLSEIAPSDAVIASNTSSLDQDAIASLVTNRPERCVGLHVTLPAYFSPALEVVKGHYTNAETLETVERLIQHLDRVALHINHKKDGNLAGGLFWNRVQAMVILECLQAIDNGSVEADEVHLALTGALAVRWPVMPILDTVRGAGLDVTRNYVTEVVKNSGIKQDEQDRLMDIVGKYLGADSPLFSNVSSLTLDDKLTMKISRDVKLIEVLLAQSRARENEVSMRGKPDAGALRQHESTRGRA